MQSNIEKHFAVSGFVMNQEKTKLLMVYHKKLNTWVIPGGHLEANEYPADGAAREIFEETGINATVIDSSEFTFKGNKKESSIATPYAMLSEFIPEKGDKPAHIHMDFIFVCIADEEIPRKRETEVADAKWMTWKEVLESDTFESINEFARKRVGKNERTQIRNNAVL